jgi:hypothetical protein
VFRAEREPAVMAFCEDCGKNVPGLSVNTVSKSLGTVCFYIRTECGDTLLAHTEGCADGRQPPNQNFCDICLYSYFDSSTEWQRAFQFRK